MGPPGSTCTSWADHITWGGMCICICVLKETRLGDCMCNCFCSVWKMKGTQKVKLAHSLNLLISTKGNNRLNVPIRWMAINSIICLFNICTALNFQYWDVSSCKPSPEDCTTISSPRDIGLDLQKANLKWRWSLEHLSPATAGLSVPCVLGLSPAGSSSYVHGRGCRKKRSPNIESLKQSLRKEAANFPVDGWPQRLMDCVHDNGDHFEQLFTILIHNACM